MTKENRKTPRVFITLCDVLKAKAKRIGDGNVSRGIKRALESFKEKI